MLTEIDLRKPCATQHIGPWLIEAQWFNQALSAIEIGQFKPADDPTEDASVGYSLSNGIATIPIRGHLMKGSSSFGGTSTVNLRRIIRTLSNEKQVKALMLHIDSPGGTAAGTSELANDIRQARGKKPVHAFIEDLGASAAYWIASQAGQISANRMAQVGSIGTMAVITDYSKAYEKNGVKVHAITTGAYKAAGAPGVQITPAQLKDFGSRIQDMNAQFLEAISIGRGVELDEVTEWATGQVWIAEKAMGLGLIDKVQSFEKAYQTLHEEVQEMARSARNSIIKSKIEIAKTY